MTLIAIHADVDRASVLSDSLSYTVTARRLRRATKVFAVPHLDAAVLTHGDAELGNFWAVHASLHSGAATFDELTDTAPEALQELWRERTMMAEHRNAIHGGNRPVPRSIAFAVGYSAHAGRFRAVAHSSDDDFQPADLQGLWIIPSPLDVRPSDIEQQRLEETFRERFDDDQPVRALRSQPAPVPPTTPEQWANLARTVREQRALADLYSGLKMYIGGDALLTTLERGHQSTRRLLTFADSGPEYEQMMAGSLHPAGQLGLCGCESGARFVDCCLEQIADEPCPCGSGTSTFADCCRVPLRGSGVPL